MSAIRRAAANALAEYFRNGLSPSLNVTVGVAAADPEENQKVPSLWILPGPFDFIPWQEDGIIETIADRALTNVGTFEGSVELRITGCGSKALRENIEEAVLSLFLEPELAPGVIAVQTDPVEINGWITTHRAICSFMLDSAEWRDELAFSKQRHSFIDVEASYPALVMRSPQYTIDQLYLALNNDLSSDIPVETVQILQDGTTTPVLGP